MRQTPCPAGEAWPVARRTTNAPDPLDRTPGCPSAAPTASRTGPWSSTRAGTHPAVPVTPRCTGNSDHAASRRARSPGPRWAARGTCTHESSGPPSVSPINIAGATDNAENAGALRLRTRDQIPTRPEGRGFPRSWARGRRIPPRHRRTHPAHRLKPPLPAHWRPPHGHGRGVRLRHGRLGHRRGRRHARQAPGQASAGVGADRHRREARSTEWVTSVDRTRSGVRGTRAQRAEAARCGNRNSVRLRAVSPGRRTVLG